MDEKNDDVEEGKKTMMLLKNQLKEEKMKDTKKRSKIRCTILLFVYQSSYVP